MKKGQVCTSFARSWEFCNGVFKIPCVNLRETLFNIVLAIDPGNIAITWHIVMDPFTHAFILFRAPGKPAPMKVIHCRRLSFREEQSKQVHTVIAVMNGHVASAFVSILIGVEPNGISDVGQTP
jgi:hypothetical protein